MKCTGIMWVCRFWPAPRKGDGKPRSVLKHNFFKVLPSIFSAPSVQEHAPTALCPSTMPYCAVPPQDGESLMAWVRATDGDGGCHWCSSFLPDAQEGHHEVCSPKKQPPALEGHLPRRCSAARMASGVLGARLQRDSAAYLPSLVTEPRLIEIQV